MIFRHHPQQSLFQNFSTHKNKTPSRLWLSYKATTSPFVCPNGKPDTRWQSRCWCLPPNACKWVCAEERRMQRNPVRVFPNVPWTGSRSLQFQFLQAPSQVHRLLTAPAHLQLSLSSGSLLALRPPPPLSRLFDHLSQARWVRTQSFLAPSNSPPRHLNKPFLLFSKSLSTSQPSPPSAVELWLLGKTGK